ncbi:MAG: penicillin acylase family protein, partial [Actinomycetota bacterium]|nr:penicillin acylase family protein [Actinomycetota bacterium]
VQAMGDAATVDLRGDKLLPLLSDVIGDQGGFEVRQALDLLLAWHQAGAHRRDLEGDDGEYEHQAAIAILDEWWPRAVEAVFGGALGDGFDQIPATIDDRADSPDHNGSSFNDGFYGQVSKDLRAILGRPVDGPFSRTYCGDGALATCRADVTQSLQDAIDAIEADQGSDMSAWDVDEIEDQIMFLPVGVAGVDPIPWQNRPTFQQVLQFSPPSSEVLGAGVAGTGSVGEIVGSTGADVLRGTPARDVIRGLGGDDTLLGLGGDDLLLGGGGDDRLRGGAGADRLRGGPGEDRCGGGPGSDRGRCERGRI